nr:aminotransferase class V-fold PLP-dependent enzyme [Gemmatimonadota bacterium]
LSSAIEKNNNLEPLHWLATDSGAQVELLPVDGDGRLDIDALQSSIARDPDSAAVVSVMWANNETGALQPVARLAELCAERGVPFHTDAVQAFGKVHVRVDQLPVDLLSVSAHKLGGPRGTGALFVRSGVELRPLLHGGRQEHGLRPGTEDVAGAVGLAAAAELAEAERGAESARLRELRDRLQTALGLGFPGLRVHAAAAERIPNLLNVSFPEVEAELLLPALDAGEIAASGGSACASGALRASHVLRAMGVAEEEGLRSVRFSLGSATTSEEIDRAIRLIPVLLEPLRTTCLA